MKRLASCAIAVVIVGGGVRAHDAEHTAVSITFARDGSFILEVANDPNWLLLRLESFVTLERADAGSNPAQAEPPNGAESPAEARPRSNDDRDARLRALAPVFIDRIVVFVDGHEVRPVSVEYLAPPPSAPTGGPTPLAAYRLRGRVSPDARALRWYYGMVVDPYPLAINRADGRSENEWIVAGEAWSGTINLTGQFVKPTRREMALRYVGLGYEQILPRGVGHVLFILGMFLLTLRLRPIILQIAAFTLSHSIALWLTAFAVVSVPSKAFIWLVALSVAYVVIENLMVGELKPWRVPAVFFFGTMHGAAFGEAVKALALTPVELPVALVWFTAGLESAQLTVLALATLFLFAGSKKIRATYEGPRSA